MKLEKINFKEIRKDQKENLLSSSGKKREEPVVPDFEEEYDFRAGERNAYLTIWEKYFGGKKVDGKDVLLEEANYFNKVADKLVMEKKVKNYEEAVQFLNKDKENYYYFNKMRNKESPIIAEEKARATTLNFAKCLNKNNFLKASQFYRFFPSKKSPGLKIETENTQSYINVFSADLFDKYRNEILNEKLKELEREGNENKIKEFKSCFEGVLK